MSPPPGEFPAEWLATAVELLGATAGRGVLPVRPGDTSMLPTFRPGQRLAVEFGPSRLRRGDLLVFRQADYLAVHRLLGSARSADGRAYLRTRGDGVLGLDPPLAPADVVGRVLAAEASAGWWDLRGRPARLYALGVACHDLGWGACGALARALDRSGRLRLRDGIAWLDRTALGVQHRLLFRLCHRRLPAPPVD
jgi:hypothetical protein